MQFPNAGLRNQTNACSQHNTQAYFMFTYI